MTEKSENGQQPAPDSVNSEPLNSLEDAVAHGTAADPVQSVQRALAEEAQLQQAATAAADFVQQHSKLGGSSALAATGPQAVPTIAAQPVVAEPEVSPAVHADLTDMPVNEQPVVLTEASVETPVDNGVETPSAGLAGAEAAPAQSVIPVAASPANSAAAMFSSGDAQTQAYTATDFAEAQQPLETPSAAAVGETPTPASQYVPATTAAYAPPSAGQSAYAGINPMADFYTQLPVQPEIRGNRGAGLAITLLATLVFGVLYAAAIGLLQLRYFPLEKAFTEELFPYLISPGYIAAVIGFWMALSLLVLVFGRAGWWAYVLGSFLGALIVWGATALGFVFTPDLVGGTDVSLRSLLRLDAGAYEDLFSIALLVRVFIGALIAREVMVWFGAWIGARGRKMTELNRAANAEYEALLLEAER